MKEKKSAYKEVFRRKRIKHYLSEEEREWNFFFKIVATVSCQS